MMLNFSEGGHPVFEDPVLLKEQKEKEHCLFISMAATKPSK